MKLCALNREQLDRLFASISGTKVAANDLTGSFSSLSLANTNGLAASKYAVANTEQQPTRSTIHNSVQPPINELATVLQALRKLREAITASNRTDVFARRAYYFNIHAAILCHDWESYVPALHSLLHTLHPRNPLPPHDLKEFVGLQILDQACRQSDYAGARETKIRYNYSDRRVEAVMKSLVADDWVTFWRMRKSVDGYQRSVMEWADGKVRVHALKCLGRAYIRADKRYVERCTERAWVELVKDGVGWDLLDGDKVVIQKPKVK